MTVWLTDSVAAFMPGPGLLPGFCAAAANGRTAPKVLELYLDRPRWTGQQRDCVWAIRIQRLEGSRSPSGAMYFLMGYGG
jgi:hypothetical protein